MHKCGVFAGKFVAHLAHRFKERLTFDVAHRATDLNQGNFCTSAFAEQMNSSFNFTGNVGNNLNGTTQIVTPPFTVDDFLIDLTCANRAGLFQTQITKTFVMSQVQIRFRAIVQDVNLAVLIRTQGARVDIKVWVKFLNSDIKSAGF